MLIALHRTERNSMESPLLRLSGELRNKICESETNISRILLIPCLIDDYATGGYMVQVRHMGGHTQSGYVETRLLPLEGSGTPRRDDETAGRYDGYYWPFHAPPARRIVNLHLVCRQVKHESSNLDPYTDNIFSFDNPISYGSFLEWGKFGKSRCAMLSTIAVQYLDFFRVCGYSDYRFYNYPFRDLLPILQRVTMSSRRLKRSFGTEYINKDHMKRELERVVSLCEERRFINNKSPRNKGLQIALMRVLDLTTSVVPWQVFIVPGAPPEDQ